MSQRLLTFGPKVYLDINMYICIYIYVYVIRKSIGPTLEFGFCGVLGSRVVHGIQSHEPGSYPAVDTPKLSEAWR